MHAKEPLACPRGIARIDTRGGGGERVGVRRHDEAVGDREAGADQRAEVRALAARDSEIGRAEIRERAHEHARDASREGYGLEPG